MKKSKIFLILLVALIIGLAHVSHHLWMAKFLSKEGKRYQPLLISEKVHNSAIDETFVYAPRVREILDGSFPLRETSVWEYQGKPSTLISETMPSSLMAGLGKITGSVPSAFILADFLFPFLTFLISFTFLYFTISNFTSEVEASRDKRDFNRRQCFRFTSFAHQLKTPPRWPSLSWDSSDGGGSTTNFHLGGVPSGHLRGGYQKSAKLVRLKRFPCFFHLGGVFRPIFNKTLCSSNMIVALAGSIFLFFAQAFVYNFPYLPSAIWEMINIGRFNSLLWFTRSFHPQITFLFLLLAIFSLFYVTAKKKIKRKWIFIAGASFGLLFYSYFFYWTWFLAGFLFYSLFLFLDKKKRYLVPRLAVVLTVSLAFSSFFWWQILLIYFKKIPNGFFERSNMYFLTNFQLMPFIRVIFFSLAFFALFPSKKSQLHYLIQSFLLGFLPLFFIPYITKVDLDDMVGHWNKFCLNSWIIIAIFILLASILKKFRQKKLINYFLVLLSVLFLIYGFGLHWQFARKNYQAYQPNSNRIALYDWLNQNTKKDEVILTLSFEENLLIPAFTHNNIFIPNFTSPALTEEIVERLLYAYKLFAINWKDVEYLFAPKEENIKLAKTEHWNFNNCGGWYVFFYQKGTKSRYLCGIKKEDLARMERDFRQLNFSKKDIPYRYNYILVGPYEKRIMRRDSLDFAKLVYENGDYSLFKLSSSVSHPRGEKSKGILFRVRPCCNARSDPFNSSNKVYLVPG